MKWIEAIPGPKGPISAKKPKSEAQPGLQLILHKRGEQAETQHRPRGFPKAKYPCANDNFARTAKVKRRSRFYTSETWGSTFREDLIGKATRIIVTHKEKTLQNLVRSPARNAPTLRHRIPLKEFCVQMTSRSVFKDFGTRCTRDQVPGDCQPDLNYLLGGHWQYPWPPSCFNGQRKDR